MFYYIIHTFRCCYNKNLIEHDKNDPESFYLFNTGLLSENGEEIYGVFVKNTNVDPHSQPWKFKGFFLESHRLVLDYNVDKPKLANFDLYGETDFQTDYDIYLSINHILDDNWERFPREIKDLIKSVVLGLVKSAFETSEKRVQRNPRLAVAQFHPKTNKIMFLLPLRLFTPTSIEIMALAIEKVGENKYRANTIFDREDAYKKARLVMKPESNWLL